MPYIGQQPTSVAFLTDTFSGNGSTTAFTLSAAPANTSSILVAISGVLQDPSTYSVVGTTLTFSPAPPSGTGNISVRFLGIPASGVTTTAYRTVTEFTATAGQTSFSVPSYTVGFIDVYRNGVMLGSADYTASNGVSVVLASGATAGDLVEVISFQVSSVLNAIPATAGSVGTTYLASSVTLTTPTLTSPIITGSTPQVTTYSSGSGTYTVPTNCRYLEIEVVGAGGGGGGSGGTTGGGGGANGTTAGDTTINSTLIVCQGGRGGAGGQGSIGQFGGDGGDASGGNVVNRGGQAGTNMSAYNSTYGAFTGGGGGGACAFGRSGGRGGGSGGTPVVMGAGGGGGAYAKSIITSPAASYTYSVAAGGAGGAAGSNGNNGEAGVAGLIIFTAYF